ncbi:MAG: hypothetical protein IIU82_02710 [Tidjanibacter sp.]|nr:hypothetical protein [Tidjanibacter sp.]
MKKNYLFGIMAIVAIMSAVSCSVEDDGGIQPNNDVTIELNLNLEGGLHTRAISDGKSVDKLIYTLFDENGNIVIKQCIEENLKDLLSGHKVSFTVAKGHTYRAVFWAQDSDCNAYTVSEDMELTVDYSGLSNDESRDAFFGFADISTNDSEPKSITLRRPFAQVNLGGYPYDIELAEKFGVKITQSTIKVKDVPTTLNLYNGTIVSNSEDDEFIDDNINNDYNINDSNNNDSTINDSNYNNNNDYTINDGDDNNNNENIILPIDPYFTDVEFSAANVPTEKLLTDVDDNGVKEEYVYLAMNYILADTTSSTHEMEFNLLASNGDVFSVSSGLGAVPVKRNWRTNIVGQYLTTAVQVTIKVDNAFEDENIINNGAYYNYNEDTTIENHSFVFDCIDNSATFRSENNSTVTLKDVTFAGKVAHIDFGEYPDVDFHTVLDGVKFDGITFSSAIGKELPPTGTKGLFGAAGWLRGKSELKNCVIKNSVCVNPAALAVDLSVVNTSECTIDKSEIGKLHVYEHAQATITNSTIDIIYSAPLDTHNGGKLVIGPGCNIGTIEVIKVTSTSIPKIEIQAGATVGTINFYGQRATAVANGSFINNGTVTTIND